MARAHRQKRSQPIRFHLTRAGWLFLGISVMVGLAAVRSQAALLWVLFGGMMGAIHASAILARRMLAGVMIKREVPARAWQRQTVHLGYFLRNRHRRGSSLALQIQELAPEGIDSAAGYCLHLPPKVGFRAGARFAARRRGRISLKDMQIATSFPFGFVKATRSIRQESSLVIWPARGHLKTNLLRSGAVEVSSAAPSGATGGQDEFFGLREYRPGDNPRWIHWRRSAGRDTPALREMARPLPEVLWVILDTYRQDSRASRPDSREKMLRFAATLIDHAFTRGYKVGLALAYDRAVAVHPPAAGRGPRRALLDALADADDNTNLPVDETVRRLRRGQLAQGQVVLLAPDRSRLTGAAVAPLRASCRHLQTICADQLEAVFADKLSARREET